MDTLSRAYKNSKEFFSSVVEWRSAATAPYFMLINTAFWWSVFYVREEVQQRLLISLAAAIFGWDILLSSSHEHSILVHLISWPIHSTLRTASVILALMGAYSLGHAELERACWMAYSTVALLILNPVWCYQKIPERVNNIAYCGYCVTMKVFYHYAVCPTVAICKGIKYVLLLRWVPAFWNYLKRFFALIVHGLYNLWISFLHSLASLLNNIKLWTIAKIHAIRDAIVNFLYGIKNWLANKIRAIRNAIRAAISAILICICNTVMAIGHWIRNKVILTGKWIWDTVVAIRGWIRAKIAALKRWFSTRIVDPIKQRVLAIGRFLRFWLCAHWWPRLKHSFIEEIGIPLQRGFNYFCYYLVYVFCGYWIKPLGGFVRRQLYTFYAYFHRILVVPFKRWMKARFDEFCVAIRRRLHRLAVAIRDSVIWPFCVIIGDLFKHVYNYFHATVLQPIYDFFYEIYKMGEDYVYINILGPACQTIVDNIPEKSPFCDDSDTELAGLLPQSVDEDEGNYSDTEGTSDRPSLPSGSLTPLTEDEREFLRGLRFPTVEASESSDEEFDLRKPRKRSKSAKAVPKDPAPSADDMHQPSESSSNAESRLAHCLSISSTSSLSDGAGSMSSTRSDALVNAKLSFGESNSDADPEKYPSRRTSEAGKLQAELVRGARKETSTQSNANTSAESPKVPVGVTKEPEMLDSASSSDLINRSGGTIVKKSSRHRSGERRTVSSPEKRRCGSRGSKTSRKRDSAPPSADSTQSCDPTNTVDEHFEVLDVIR